MTHTTRVAAPRFRTVDLAYIALFAVVMAVCAWISIPMTVPFTLQTFAVFAALGTLGGRRGTYAVAVYLLLGAVGLPVFAGFQGGLGALLGTTGEYILGFLASALVYWLVTAHLGNSLPVTVVAMALGLAVCYAFGTAWFLVVYADQRRHRADDGPGLVRIPLPRPGFCQAGPGCLALPPGWEISEINQEVPGRLPLHFLI